jgi:hypothetical protein
MGENRFPPGYVPLTIHELSSGRSGRSGQGRSSRGSVGISDVYASMEGGVASSRMDNNGGSRGGQSRSGRRGGGRGGPGGGRGPGGGQGGQRRGGHYGQGGGGRQFSRRDENVGNNASNAGAAPIDEDLSEFDDSLPGELREDHNGDDDFGYDRDDSDIADD